LCFERHVSKNSAIRLKSYILTPPNFGAGYATASGMTKNVAT